MTHADLISNDNLLLAWRRIGTARNHQYKRFFRPLYLAYELAHEDNLKRLHQRLRGTWQPSSPMRVWLPKPSGLQRPVSLLTIDDQIVLQAIANVFAAKLRQRRAAVEGLTVFSNLLDPSADSKFFIQDWHRTYLRFQRRCLAHFTAGRRWVAHFDLAAFYDTISHELLIRTVSPRGGYRNVWQVVSAWLKVWSSTRDGKPFHHGIPQGPVASDFLAESVLLPIDEALSREDITYVRYADDIRIFAKSKSEAQRAAVRLEVLTRTAGLIPQGKKFALVEARSIADVIGMLPSLAPPDQTDAERDTTLSAVDAEAMIRAALRGRPHTVHDKTKLRFALYRAPRSRRILGIVLRLLPRYPEHIDAFVAFLSIYTKSRAIEKAIRQALLDGSPYDYVRAELWLLLSRLASRRAGVRLRSAARADVGDRNNPAWLKFGALSFLRRCELLGDGKCTDRIRHQPAIVQALLVPGLDESVFSRRQLIASLLRSKAPEPGLMLAAELARRGETHRDYGVQAKELAPEVQNTFKALKLLTARRGVAVDQVGDLLQKRYATAPAGWREILGPEYLHCLRILVQADAHFDPARSHWLQQQNSFNDALTRRLIGRLTSAGLPGAARLIGRDGKLIKFGSLLAPGAPFVTHYPDIANCFRAVNDRRNALPASHPYDEKRGVRNRYLSYREQRTFVRTLAQAYSATLALVATLP